MKVLKRLQRTTAASVYLVRFKDDYYALKAYPFKDGKPNVLWYYEQRFQHFNHQHILKMHDAQEEKQIITRDSVVKASYILLDYPPYGNLYDLIMTHNRPFEDKLSRTYFHQLISALGYIHSHGAAHLDLHLGNLWLDENFLLKVTDFKVAYLKGDEKIRSLGTPGYRAPEIKEKRCKNPQAADIFSAGIILFLFKSRGKFPFENEDSNYESDLYELYQKDNDEFWRRHTKLANKSFVSFDDDFKQLFNIMVHPDPEKRATLKDIMKSSWYNGSVYSYPALEVIMKNSLDFI